MMIRTRKHFLYRWLKQDLFGEYTLRKTYKTRFVRKILKKVWKTVRFMRYKRNTILPIRKRLNKRVITRLRASFINYKNSLIRKKLLIKPIDKKQKKMHLYNSFLIKKSFIKVVGVRKKLIRVKKIKKLSMFKKNSFVLMTSRVYTKLRKRNSLRINWGKRFGASRWFFFTLRKNLGLKVRMRRFKRRNKKRSPVLRVRLKFRKKRSLKRVPRYERKTLRNIFNLRYYNITHPYKILLNKTRSKSSDISFGSFLANCEIRLNTLILRSSLLENAYIVSNIIKRGCFLVNGYPCYSSATCLKKWDLVALDKQIWWYSYARLHSFLLNRYFKIHFFKGRRKKSNNLVNIAYKTRLLIKKTVPNDLNKNNKIKRISYVKATKQSYNRKFNNKAARRGKKKLLFKPTSVYNRIKTLKLGKFLIKRLNTRAWKSHTAKTIINESNKAVRKTSRFANKFSVILPTPSHIEISYKILSFILHRFPYKVTDSNLPTSVRLIKRLRKKKTSKKRRPFPYLKSKNSLL